MESASAAADGGYIFRLTVRAGRILAGGLRTAVGSGLAGLPTEVFAEVRSLPVRITDIRGRPFRTRTLSRAGLGGVPSGAVLQRVSGSPEIPSRVEDAWRSGSGRAPNFSRREPS